MKSKDPSIKERLTCIETKLDELNLHFTNHLSAHFQILLVCVGCALTGIIGVIGWLVTCFVK